MSITNSFPISYQNITNDSTFDLSEFSNVNIVDPNQPIVVDPQSGLLTFNQNDQNIEEAQIETASFTDVPGVFIKRSNTITPDGNHYDFDNVISKITSDMFSPYTLVTTIGNPLYIIPDNYVLVRNSVDPAGFQWQYIGDASIELDPSKSGYIVYNDSSDIGYLQYITDTQIQSNTLSLNTLVSSSPRRFFIGESSSNSFGQIVFLDISDSSVFLQASQTLTSVGTNGQILSTDGTDLQWISQSTLFPTYFCYSGTSKQYILDSDVQDDTFSLSRLQDQTAGYIIRAHGTTGVVSAFQYLPESNLNTQSVGYEKLKHNQGTDNGLFLRCSASTPAISPSDFLFVDILDSSAMLTSCQNLVSYSALQFLRRNSGNTDIEFTTLDFNMIAGSVTNSQITSITFSKISDSSNQLIFLQGNVGTSGQLFSSTGTTGQWINQSSLSIATTQLTGTITNAQIASITFSKISDASSNLGYLQSTNGTSGQFLQATGSSSIWHTLDFSDIVGTVTNAQINSIVFAKISDSSTPLQQMQALSAMGSNTQLLSTNGTDFTWTSQSSLSIPFSSINNSSTPLQQLQALAALGSSGQFLTTNGTIFTWTTSGAAFTPNTLITTLNSQSFVNPLNIQPPLANTGKDQIFTYDTGSGLNKWRPPTSSNSIWYFNSSNVISELTSTSAFVTFNSSSVPAAYAPGASKILITNSGGNLDSIANAGSNDSYIVLPRSSNTPTNVGGANIIPIVASSIAQGLTGTSAVVAFNSSSIPTTIADVTPYIPTNSIALSQIAQGNRCGLYVNNSYTSANVSLYPASNVTQDSIPYIDYTSGTNIVMNSMTGTAAINYFNSSNQVSSVSWSSETQNGIFQFRTAGDITKILSVGSSGVALANCYYFLSLNANVNGRDGSDYFVFNDYYRQNGLTGASGKPCYRQAGTGISGNNFAIDLDGLSSDGTGSTKGAWFINNSNGTANFITGNTANDPMNIYTSNRANVFNPSSSQTITKKLYVDQTTYAWLTVSDKKMKNDKGDVQVDLIEAFKDMPVRKYSFKEDKGQTEYTGFYADDLLSSPVFEGLVKESEGIKFVNHNMMIQLLYSLSVQLSQTCKDLEKENSTSKSRITELENTVKQLQKNQK